MRWIWGLLVCVALNVPAPFARAEALPMVSRASLMVDRTPFIETSSSGSRASPSLFAGIAGKSLFAPSTRPQRRLPPRRTTGGPLDELRTLIARAEAGAKGYDAVQYGADILPPDHPTALTVQQIYDWIDATPGQPHAIGRYQFIPPTLRRLMKASGVPPTARFSPELQDRLADLLLVEAGLRQFLAGDVARRNFMNNLAKIWAGLPNDSGKSHYDGYAGNKATMTWAYFDAQMAQIFPG